MQIILNSIHSIHWGCRWRRNVILPIIRHCNRHKVFEYFVIVVSEFENCSFLNISNCWYYTINRKWNIKILQYSCSYENLAPAGCLQYFYGMGATGSVSSFNYEGGIHLANQDQKVCVRCDFFYVKSKYNKLIIFCNSQAWIWEVLHLLEPCNRRFWY